MTSQSRTPNSESTPDPPGFEVNDLIIDLAPRRVRRGATVIPLKALTFDLLVTLVRAAPGLVSFDELTERVWPGLVIAPETISPQNKYAAPESPTESSAGLFWLSMFLPLPSSPLAPTTNVLPSLLRPTAVPNTSCAPMFGALM
jgi:hypothetical protein